LKFQLRKKNISNIFFTGTGQGKDPNTLLLSSHHRFVFGKVIKDRLFIFLVITVVIALARDFRDIILLVILFVTSPSYDDDQENNVSEISRESNNDSYYEEDEKSVFYDSADDESVMRRKLESVGTFSNTNTKNQH
jgi:hypothetical protein